MKPIKNPASHRKCPHCKRKLTLKEIITLLHGSGFAEYVIVKTPDGVGHVVEAGLVNPETVEIVEES
jgi:hypothetical protein